MVNATTTRSSGENVARSCTSSSTLPYVSVEKQQHLPTTITMSVSMMEEDDDEEEIYHDVSA